MSNIKSFLLSEVKLTDAYLVNAFNKEYDYLVSLDTDRLLAGFRDTAGLELHGVTRYGGWENTLIGGHTLGHYISACVNEYLSANSTPTQKLTLLGILEKIVQGLKDCQDSVGTGFIFGATINNRDNIEEQFDYVEQNRTDIFKESWVPWYTLHKIYEGLIAMMRLSSEAASTGTDSAFPQDAPRLAEREQLVADTSLAIASWLTDWVFKRVSSWDEVSHRTVLSVEYGGIADCLYHIYSITGRPEHLVAAHAFDEDELFEKVLAARPGDDILNDLHANTTIPKYLGAMRHYLVTGEERYLAYVRAFWTLVANNHSYITGGNSEWEHFGRDGVLDGERTNCNCETCNVHNMLKLTKLLFEETGDVKYADWYENAFINAILSSQNPATGMSMYFQPMATGYFKTYSTRETNFWCCTGTGMENFSKLQESFYFRSVDALIVNQYFSSVLDCGDIRITQRSTIPEGNTVTFTFDADYDGRLLFRLPDWLAGAVTIEADGSPLSYSVCRISDIQSMTNEGGYACVNGCFKAGTVIELKLPMEVRAHNLPDGPQTIAFKYGPVVLSALLGTKDMITTTTGVDVTIPAECLVDTALVPGGDDCLMLEDDSVDVRDFMAEINKHMVRNLPYDTLSFRLTGVRGNLCFVTHYKQHTERYGIYFRFK